MFLYIEDNKVKVTDEGMMLSCVEKLYKKDKHVGKPYFNDCITYIYFVYKYDSMYQNQFSETKKKIVCINHVKNRNWEDLESDKDVKEIIDTYIDSQCTVTMRMILKVKEDIEKYIEYLRDIPYTKEEVIEVKIPIKDGDIDTTKIVKHKVLFQNGKEKKEALEMIDTFISLVDKYSIRLKKEGIDKKKKGFRLFDNV